MNKGKYHFVVVDIMADAVSFNNSHGRFYPL